MDLRRTLLPMLLALAVAATRTVADRGLKGDDEKMEAAMGWGAGTMETYATVAANGDEKALAVAVAEAMSRGDALVLAEALVMEASKNPSRVRIIAGGVSAGTDLSKGDVIKLLVAGEKEKIARAIAKTDQTVESTGVSLSQAVESAQSTISSAVTTAYSAVSKGNDVHLISKVKGKSIGKAISRAFALAEIPVSLAGDGYGSKKARDEGDLIAISSAEVLVGQLDKANAEFGKSKASYRTDIIGEEIALASAAAFAMGSQTGEGFTHNFQVKLAEYISKAIARIMGEALAVAFEQDLESYKFIIVEGTAGGSIPAQPNSTG